LWRARHSLSSCSERENAVGRHCGLQPWVWMVGRLGGVLAGGAGGRGGGTRWREDRGRPCVGGVSEGRQSGLVWPHDLADRIGASFRHCLVHWWCGWGWQSTGWEPTRGLVWAVSVVSVEMCLLSVRATLRALVVAAGSFLPSFFWFAFMRSSLGGHTALSVRIPPV
jgi:hypothetical protein